jgi:hypothetical protein
MTRHVHDRLAYYLDLAPDQRREVDAHLATCAECRATLAAYQRQDAALSAITEITTHRDLSPISEAERWGRPRRLPAPRRAFGYLGDALALGGLGALGWLAVLQVQLARRGGSAPGSAIPESGIAIPPTSVQLPSPWLPALPWIAAALLVVGVLFILSRKSLLPTVAGAVLSGLLLISFVPPLSALPNPVAVYWRIAGGYSYDPHLPFKNSFLIAGNPDQDLKPYLDQLVGQVGLSPLDPARPLARYEILRVGLHPNDRRVALVTTRFIYADGSSRLYPVPLFDPASDVGGFWLAGWREDGLQRLRSQHLAFPGQPFATDASPLRLGLARRLDLDRAANRLDEVNPGHWLWNSVRVQRLVWAPEGSAFLAAMETDPGLRQLWLVPLDGSAPIPIGPPADIREYGWSPDGQTVIYIRLDPAAFAADPARPYAIMAASRNSHVAPIALATALTADKLPGLTAQGAWFFSDKSLWLAPFDGSPAQRLVADLVTDKPALPPRPAPDGTRLAFGCGSELCLASVDGAIDARVPLPGAAEATWAADGTRLAVVDRDPNDLRPVRLVILSRDGETLLTRDIAPRDVTDPPQWTPDGGAVFVQTYPQNGRRIIALDLASAQVTDLSQEHWDAYFALTPDGTALLLNNGRGDFWTAAVLRKP